MNEPTILDVLNTLGSVATPVLVLILTAIGWNVRNRLQRRQELEDMLREDRVSIYNDIMEPFVIMLTSDAAWKADPRNKNKDKNETGLSKMKTLEYRKTAFKMSLFGSDGVVKAYNDLMQHFIRERNDLDASEDGAIHMMSLIGTFLLEIRKSMGNEATKLDNWDMLEWFVKEARQCRPARSPGFLLSQVDSLRSGPAALRKVLAR